MLFLLLAVGLASSPDDLAGTWAPPCMRTVIGTGTCAQIEVVVRKEQISVFEITQSRSRHGVRQGRHVFRESTVRTGPLAASLEGDTLRWTAGDGTEAARTRVEAEGEVRLEDGDQVWHRVP